MSSASLTSTVSCPDHKTDIYTIYIIYIKYVIDIYV